MENAIENKVAKSGLITLSLDEFVQKGERVLFDIKPLLWQELVLKEKDFRKFVAENEWSVYKDQYIALTCTTDAIVPSWAYMLLTVALKPFAKKIVFGTIDDLERELYTESIESLDISNLSDQRVLIKGCGDAPIPEVAFVMLSNKLLPIVKSLMFGEACSNVPLFKRK